MQGRNYQDAVQALKSRLGGRWEGMERAGREEMIKILKDRLGYDTRAANDAIDAMVAAGTPIAPGAISALGYWEIDEDRGD